MIQEFEYIESYFQGLLSDEEIKIFDQKLANDPAFAENVAFYLNAQNAARSLAHEEKINRFRKIPVSSPVSQIRVMKQWIPYVAAAAVISAIILLTVFYFNDPSPEQLAHQYVEKEFATLGVPMGTAEDSLEQAARLYNAGQNELALASYEKIIQQDPGNSDAIKYAGIIALRLRQYDKALAYFQNLEKFSQLYANPGKFYSAIALLERNHPGDQSNAKKLLQEVVKDNLEGKATAEKWLKEW